VLVQRVFDYILYRCLDAPLNQYEHYGEKTNLLSLLGMEHRFLSHPACGLVDYSQTYLLKHRGQFSFIITFTYYTKICSNCSYIRQQIQFSEHRNKLSMYKETDFKGKGINIYCCHNNDNAEYHLLQCLLTFGNT
jgi:hypothetical protein